MLDYTFGFWQVLFMLFIIYHIAVVITKSRLSNRRTERKSKVVKIVVGRENNVWFAYEEATKKFLVQTASYPELQTALGDLNPDITYIIEEEKLKALLGDKKDANSI